MSAKILWWLALTPARTIADGWALWVLWGWFVVPLGVQQISLVHAMGLDLIVGFFFACAALKAPDTDNDEHLWFATGKLIIAPMIVGIGWIIQAIGI